MFAMETFPNEGTLIFRRLAQRKVRFDLWEGRRMRVIVECCLYRVKCSSMTLVFFFLEDRDALIPGATVSTSTDQNRSICRC